MNTDLMLQIADEIETHPERYDQHAGIFMPGRETTCPVCVARQAIGAASKPTHVTEEWDEVAEQARKLLELTEPQARGLFSEHPKTAMLTTVFPWISTEDLNTLEELEGWTLGRDAGLRPRANDAGESELCSFRRFWNEQVPHEHTHAWDESSARVMAATLRLIAHGHEETHAC